MTVSMKGRRVQQRCKANKRTHQRAHWSGQPVCGLRTGSRSLGVFGWTRGPASDAPVVHKELWTEQTVLSPLDGGSC